MLNMFNIAGYTLIVEENVKGSIGPSSVSEFAYFFIPIVVLCMAIIFSQKLGVMGANVAVDGAKKFRDFAKKSTWGATKFGAHYVDRKMAETTGFSWMGLKEGWKDRQARIDSEAMAMSSGKMENVLENTISRGSSLNPIFGFKRLYKGTKNDGFRGALKELVGE